MHAHLLVFAEPEATHRGWILSYRRRRWTQNCQVRLKSTPYSTQEASDVKSKYDGCLWQQDKGGIKNPMEEEVMPLRAWSSVWSLSDEQESQGPWIKPI